MKTGLLWRDTRRVHPESSSAASPRREDLRRLKHAMNFSWRKIGALAGLPQRPRAPALSRSGSRCESSSPGSIGVAGASPCLLRVTARMAWVRYHPLQDPEIGAHPPGGTLRGGRYRRQESGESVGRFHHCRRGNNSAEGANHRSNECLMVAAPTSASQQPADAALSARPGRWARGWKPPGCGRWRRR